MSDTSRQVEGRRRFLTSMGVVATGATLAATSSQAAQNSSTDTHRFVPARHPGDAWLEQSGVSHRAFIDSASTQGGATALHYANNMLMVHAEDYGGSDADYALVVCFRHQSTPFGYNDVIWEKYGEHLSAFMDIKDTRNSPEPFRQNPMRLKQSGLANRGNTVDALAARGVSFAICNRATLNISGFLARNTDGTAQDIYQELLANNIPNSRFIPVGVLTVTRSQEYGYSLLYAG
ncbi:MAG: hypothetical protein RQ757_10135 [Pseudomonadales bacterium]|nr:hypothetical protein [Pseudomonadales bacterium]